MEYNGSFFCGEERCGFYIRPMVKRGWAVEMDVLEVISDICRRHGIRWFTDGGTTLGAVRHGGFIPWDDDIDIAMLRTDYERFLEIAPDELPQGWRLFNGRQEADPTGGVLRVINTETVCVDPGFLEKYHGCPYIMGVDIFVLDSIPDDPEEDEIFRSLATIAYDAFNRIPGNILRRECDPEILEGIMQLQAVFDVDIDDNKPLKGQMLRLADQISAAYYDQDTSYVAVIPYYSCNTRVRCRTEWYSDVVYMPFESIEVPVPIGYDGYLRTWYGDDYMTPRQVGGHEYPCFGKAEERLKQY